METDNNYQSSEAPLNYASWEHNLKTWTEKTHDVIGTNQPKLHCRVIVWIQYRNI
jgi:hypothetical protein